jgi:hypothetical protein
MYATQINHPRRAERESRFRRTWLSSYIEIVGRSVLGGIALAAYASSSILLVFLIGIATQEVYRHAGLLWSGTTFFSLVVTLVPLFLMVWFKIGDTRPMCWVVNGEASNEA